MDAQRGQQPEAGEQPLALTAAGGPTVLRIALGGQLRRLREHSGVTREEAGHLLRASHAKISRLECGKGRFKERDLQDLLTLYGVTDEQLRDQFLVLGRQANERGWWHQYDDLLPSWFETYVGLEQAAESIRWYEPQFVPGLLQTPDYARAVITLGHGHQPAAELNRRLELRLRRQEVLHRAQPPELWAVVDEAALSRPVGGTAVLRAQIAHLIEQAQLPHVTLQLMPYAAGGHAAAGGPFILLRFPEADLPDIVYLEQLTSALYLDKRRDIEEYLVVMDRLAVQADTPEQTPQRLRALLSNL